MRQSTAARWRKGLVRAVVVVVVMLLVYALDRAAQDDGTAFTAPSLVGSSWHRLPSQGGRVSDILPELDPVSASKPEDTLIVSADGLPLVAERRQPYRSTVTAGMAVHRLLQDDPGPDVLGHTGLYELRPTCLRICPELLVVRGGNTVILLGRLNDDQQSERALADLARRYASSLPDARGPVEPTAWWVRSALGLAMLMLVVSPFLIWRSTLAIRARTLTPHRHGRDEPPPPPQVVDVCTVASKARGRARRLFVAQVGIFLVAGALATNYALAAFIVFATPVAWLLGRTVTRRRGGAPPGRRWSMAGSPGPALVTFFAWPLIATMLAVGGAAAAEGAFGPEAERAQAFELEGAAPITGIPLVAGSLVVVSVLARANRRWRLSAARRGPDVESTAPLLYLRAFEDDRLSISSAPAGRRPVSELFTLRVREPYEEALAWELAQFGPVVAVAEPGAPLLAEPLGAAREQLPDADWQEVVRQRMSESALIVAAIGSTPGLLWEIDRLVRDAHLDRVVLVVPPDTNERIRARWAAVDEAITAAGGRSLRVPVDPACVLAARLLPNGLWQVAIADRRDEAAYRAAVDVHLRATLGSGVTDGRSLATRTVAMGRRIAGTIADPKAAIAALRAQLAEDLAALRADIRRVLADAQQRTQTIREWWSQLARRGRPPTP